MAAFWASRALTPMRSSLVGEAIFCQCSPPSVVSKTLPCLPTTQQTISLGADPASKEAERPLLWLAQDVPPSEERRMTPWSPRIQTVLPSGVRIVREEGLAAFWRPIWAGRALAVKGARVSVSLRASALNAALSFSCALASGAGGAFDSADGGGGAGGGACSGAPANFAGILLSCSTGSSSFVASERISLLRTRGTAGGGGENVSQCGGALFLSRAPRSPTTGPARRGF